MLVCRSRHLGGWPVKGRGKVGGDAASSASVSRVSSSMDSAHSVLLDEHSEVAGLNPRCLDLILHICVTEKKCHPPLVQVEKCSFTCKGLGTGYTLQEHSITGWLCVNEILFKSNTKVKRNGMV